MTRTITANPALRVAAALSFLLLANCATSHVTVPREEAAYRPAPGTSFVVPVRAGDSVSEIAERYRVSMEDIIAMNNLSDRDRVVTGDRLYIPAYGRRDLRPAPERAAPAQRTAAASVAANRPRPAGRVAVAPLAPVSYASGPALVPTPRPRPATGGWFAWNTPSRNTDTVPLSRPVSIPVPPAAAAAAAAAAGRFIWPVDGRVLSGFGGAVAGERNDGINIAAPHGTPVRAAADGTVTYVGNELKGYGNLLLIQHENGFVTAYAHADRIAVERGERVRRGDIVAYTGATGDVTQPQLHFEIRQNTRPVNPASFLGGTGNQANRLPRDPARS